jgi:uncharacterized membrane protein YdjX (TVP38/TMEM64 family)
MDEQLPIPNDPRPAESKPVAYAGRKAGEPYTFEDVKRWFRRLGPMGPMAIVAASLPAIGGFVVLGTMGPMGAWLRDNGNLGVAVFIAAFAVLAGLALLPTYAQSVLAGWAFGLFVGSTAAMAGITGASLIGYLVARRGAGDRLVELIDEQPKWRAVYDALIRSGSGRALLTVTLLRIPHNSPFAITNLVMAACRVPPWVYIVGTVIGIAPRTILAVYLGARARHTDFAMPHERWLYVVWVAGAVLAIAVIGAIANHAVKRVTAGMTSDGDPSKGG